MSRIAAAVRQQVRERARERCEYCGITEQFTPFSHQVDHIIPPRHGGSDDLDNLAWACFQCNNNKGTDIATFDLKTGHKAWLYDPRSHHWDDHFVLSSDGIISGKTAEGRATVHLLRMNEPKRVETRRAPIKAGRWN